MELSEVQKRGGRWMEHIPSVDETQQRLSEINARVVSFIKERPGTCLLGALVFGFIVGRAASR